jgi:hypothetical protein
MRHVPLDVPASSAGPSAGPGPLGLWVLLRFASSSHCTVSSFNKSEKIAGISRSCVITINGRTGGQSEN